MKKDVSQGSSTASFLLTEMQQRRLTVLLFCVLISSCVYCQRNRSYDEEEIDEKQLAAPTKGVFGKHWRHKVFDTQSKLSAINNETIANAIETGVENSGSREGKCTVVISPTKTENVHTSTNS